MLHISKISHLDAYTELYWKQRMGKLTASEIGKLISKDSDKGKFTAGAITYIEGIAGEIMTKQRAKEEFFNSNVNYGNATEAEAIMHFSEITGRTIMRNTERNDTHRLIIQDEYSACTPDALVCLAPMEKIYSTDGERLNVAPLETKCPPVLHRFIKLYRCTKPADLKETEPLYYWQVLTQLSFCDSLIAYFAAYHPAFSMENRMRIIDFKKIDLVEDCKKLNNTLECAKAELKNILNLFK